MKIFAQCDGACKTPLTSVDAQTGKPEGWVVLVVEGQALVLCPACFKKLKIPMPVAKDAK